jgi:hypothetical protein
MMEREAMAQSHLTRLARMAGSLEQKRTLCAQLQELLDTASGVGIVIAGEKWMLGELREQLKKAQLILEALEQAGNVEAVSGSLDEFESLLSAVEWEVADQTCESLTQKIESQKTLILQYEEKIADWRGRLRELPNQLIQARDVRAPVIKARWEVQRLQALVDQSERALRERQFSALAESLAQLDASTDSPQQVAAQISDKISQIRQFARQADLLLLQSPLVVQRYQYTVLLRTPSEPGVHGINIQSSSTLVQQDRQLMNTIIDQITEAIDKGLARLFSQRTSAPASQPDVIPPSATQGADQAGLKETVQTDAQRNLRPVASAAEHFAPLNVNELAKDAGDLMYRLFMPEEMQRYLNDTPCSITITTNDLELPWELMCYDGKFLCLDRPVARMPMGHAFPRGEKQQYHAGGKLRFLLIYADPASNLPSAKREIEQIKDGLAKDWKDQIEIDVLNREQADGRKLNECLRSGIYDVIHYAGHAAFDPKDPDLSGLLLHGDEVFFAQKIRRLVEGRPLVFLNACQSGRTANEQEPEKVGQYLQKPAEGLASSFIYGGALGCIGALWPVYDQPATDFAVQFYNKVLEGYMIGEAMRQTRNAIREKYPNQMGVANLSWSARHRLNVCGHRNKAS